MNSNASSPIGSRLRRSTLIPTLVALAILAPVLLGLGVSGLGPVGLGLGLLTALGVAAVLVWVLSARWYRKTVAPLRGLIEKMPVPTVDGSVSARTGDDELDRLVAAAYLLLAERQGLAEALAEQRSALARAEARAVDDGVKQAAGELEEARRRLDRAVEAAANASQGKRLFLADMSHEVHTQLSAVIGMSEMLLETHLDPEQRRFASTLMRSGQLLESAVADILDVSRIEAGGIQLEDEDFDLGGRVEEVAELFAEHAHGKGLELTTEIASELPERVKGDRARIGQALGNLLANVLKRADEGEVVVRASVTARQADRAHLRLEVASSSVDVAAVLRDTDLECFAQPVRGSASADVGGAGQGLGIAKALVSLMKGTAGVEMDPGGGMSLWMTLPLAVMCWESREQLARGPLAGLRLLIAVPGRRTRTTLASYAGRAGAQVIACASVGEARDALGDARLSGRRLDAVVLDSGLGDADSLEMERLLSSDPDAAGLPRVLLIPSRQAWHPEQVAGLRVSAYLVKPVRRTLLIRCLRQVSGRGAESLDGADAGQAALGGDISAPLGLKVLVADDNTASADTVAAMLEVLGCDVRRVFDGQAAIEVFAAESFDLVLMDCKMPVMDGYEATRRIRLSEASETGRHTPVVALTAHAMEGDRERCQTAGMDDYLSKPLSLSALRTMLLKWSKRGEADSRERPGMEPAAGVTEPSEPDPGRRVTLELDDLDGFPTVDEAVLAEARAIARSAGSTVAARLIQSFLASAPDLVDRVRQGLESSSPAAVAESAHALGSAATVLGAMRLGTFCGRLERFSAAGYAYFPPARLVELLEKIAAETRALLQVRLAETEGPLGPAKGAAAEPAPLAGPEAGLASAWTGADPTGALVLVVDEAEGVSEAAKAALERAGLRAAGARDGRGALEAVRFQPPDLILLDVMTTSDMDGYETCRRLRSMPGLELTPILMLTGLEDTAAIERAYECGATDFYARPVNWGVLAHRIRYLLRGHATLDALHRSEARNSALIAAIPDVLVRLDRKGQVLQQKTGRSLDRLRKRPAEQVKVLADLLPESACGQIIHQLEAALSERGVREIELELLDDQGEPLVLEARLTAVDGHQAMLLLRDVTERRRRQRVIHQLAYQDSLTGLANRQQFSQDLAGTLSRARRREDRLALLYLDLDQFKRINDSLGHGVGDELLREAARRLQTAVDDATSSSNVRGRAIASTIARLGGDELTVILKGKGAERASRQVAERILSSFREPFRCSGLSVVCTLSIGIALSPQDGDTPDALLKHADTALYAAKLDGRNTYRFYTPSMGELASRRLDVEARLRRALEQDELRLHYQPIIDLKTGELLCLEALLRWQDPELGLIEPERFISVAEESGLIQPIGAWVLDALTAQLGVWDQQGWQPAVSLNLADAQFGDQGLVDRLLALSKHRPAGSIQLEITESLLLARDRRLIETLGRLRERGLRVAIDDFGTGYSSLSLLKHLPIDTLKVDPAFVREIGHDELSDVLVQTIVDLGRGLGLRVIAEGVETEAQLQLLRRAGCHGAQGFFLCEPRPADALDPVRIGTLTSA